MLKSGSDPGTQFSFSPNLHPYGFQPKNLDQVLKILELKIWISYQTIKSGFFCSLVRICAISIWLANDNVTKMCHYRV